MSNKMCYYGGVEFISSPDTESSDNTAYLKALTKTARQSIVILLTPRQQRVIELKLFQELTQSQIAEMLNISQPTVSRTYKQALSKMQEPLKIAALAIKNYIQMEENDE